MKADTAFTNPDRVTLAPEQLEAEPSVFPDAEQPRNWYVSLVLRLKGAPGELPYEFLVKMVGLFEVVESFPDEQVERLVRFNGPAVLYSSAREIVGFLSASGPHRRLVLPSVTFVEQDPKPELPSLHPSTGAPRSKNPAAKQGTRATSLPPEGDGEPK